VQDILWRRTKLGLKVGAEDATRLEEYLAAQDGSRAMPA
jgi:glycerol-3-phosphate dehydrogenase